MKVDISWSKISKLGLAQLLRCVIILNKIHLIEIHVPVPALGSLWQFAQPLDRNFFFIFDKWCWTYGKGKSEIPYAFVHMREYFIFSIPFLEQIKTTHIKYLRVERWISSLLGTENWKQIGK